MSAAISDISESVILTGPLLSEPMRVVGTPMSGDGFVLVNLVGTRTKTFRSGVTLSAKDLEGIQVERKEVLFAGNPRLFKLGLEALRISLAQEYDPCFGLSISRVDPLPHQLDAVYNHLLKSPRCRFLLADDAGAGKTIMAGLLLKECASDQIVRPFFGGNWVTLREIGSRKGTRRSVTDGEEEQAEGLRKGAPSGDAAHV